MRSNPRDATTWVKPPPLRVNYRQLVGFLLVVFVVVGGLVTGHLGAWILGGVVVSVVLLIASLIIVAFAGEVLKIFRR